MIFVESTKQGDVTFGPWSIYRQSEGLTDLYMELFGVIVSKIGVAQVPSSIYSAPITGAMSTDTLSNCQSSKLNNTFVISLQSDFFFLFDPFNQIADQHLSIGGRLSVHAFQV